MLIHKLHEIFGPFLLPRLKIGIERSHLLEKAYMLCVPLTEHYRKGYGTVIKGCFCGLLPGE